MTEQKTSTSKVDILHGISLGFVRKKSSGFLKFEPGKHIKIKGMALWGYAGAEDEKWGVIFSDVEEPSLDTTASTRKMAFRISTHPIHLFEISPSREEYSDDEFAELIESFDHFVKERGCQLKPLPFAQAPLALPGSALDIEQTESFEGLITDIEDNVAFVTLVGESESESYMEIPCGDLQKYEIECKEGIIFSLLLKHRGDWEKVEFARTERPPMMKSEFDDLLKYYEEKYGDV